MQGIRKSTAEFSWAVTLTMENGTKFDWAGEADDQDYAEGQAIAEAVAKTGEQVLEVVGVRASLRHGKDYADVAEQTIREINLESLGNK